MTYTIKILPDEAIIIVNMADFDIREDLQTYLKESRNIFDNLSEKTHMITDARNLTISFSGMVEGLARLARADNLFDHPNAGRMILVSNGKLIQMGAKAFKQNQYGGFSVDIYETLDEALAAIRAG